MWFLLQTHVPDGLQLPHVDPQDVFTPAELAAAESYARLPRLLWAGRTAAELLVLAGLVALAPWLAGRLRSPLAVLAVTLAAIWLVALPFRAVGHWWRRRHDLSDQGYLAWLVDPWLETLALAAVACVAYLLARALERRFAARWWIPGGVALAAVGAAVVLLQPLVLAPRLERLADPQVAADVRALGRRLGVEVDRVEVKEERRRTTRISAEVAGIGPTRRVILWDTTLARAPEREVRFLVAHELAHVADRHLWKGIAWFALAALPIAFVVAGATRRRGGIGSAAAVPAAVLALVLAELALQPVANALSRRYEAEADWDGLRAARDPAAAVALFQRFGTANLADPAPPGWAYGLLATHPSLVERIAMARAFRAGSGSLPGSATSSTRRSSRP